MSTRRVAPGPYGHPLFGCGGAYVRDPLGFNTEVTRRYGGVVRIRALPRFYFFLVSDPDAVEYVLHGNQKNYRKPALFTKTVGRIAGLGILTSDGETWRRNRRLMQPAFHRQRIAGMVAVMADAASQTATRLAEAARAGRPVDLLAEMTRLSLGVASRTLFSTDVSGESDAIGKAVRVVFEHLTDLVNTPYPVPDWVPTPANRRFHRARAHLDDLVYGLIRDRKRTRADAGDLLGMLLLARDEETGEAMSDRQVRDEALTILVAGHETTAAALAWAWYLLAQDPDSADRLRQEADDVLGDRPPAFDDLGRLAFARAIFEETLRLYPGAWGQPRQAIADDEIGGYFIPGGSIVTVSQWVTHRRPDLWDDPDRFDPDRFAPGRAEGRHRFAYYPFGGGGRVCIGSALALAEAQVALASLGRRFSFRLAPGPTIEPDASFTLRPSQAVMMNVNER
jgi:cytochrome P450